MMADVMEFFPGAFALPSPASSEPPPASRKNTRAVGHLLLIAMGSTIALGCPQGSGQRPIETTPALTTDDPDAEADLRDADRAAEEGRTEAAALYRSFLEEHPSDPLKPLAELGLGRVLLGNGDAAGALTHFDRAATSDDEVVRERARFHRGVALHLLGRHEEALDLLEPLRGRMVDPRDTALLLRTIAAASMAMRDPVAALEALDLLVEANPSEADTSEARARIEAIATRELPDAEVSRAYGALEHDGAAWPFVALRAIRAAYESGDVDRVRTMAAELRAEGLELSDELSQLVSRADRIAIADPRVIGAILPLSGRGREIGQRALRGLMLALGPADAPPSPTSTQLVFRDDGGDPDRAVRAVEELVSTHRAIAIVGPLDGPSAAAAARRAEQLGVPLIALSGAAEITSAGPMAFRLFPTPDGEVRALVRAARARGATRFAVLHPANAFGRAMRDALTRGASQEGGTVAASISYAPNATSFGPQVTELARSSADAVLVADHGRALALIAPALAAGGLWSSGPEIPPPARGRRITVLVPSVGFDARLPSTTGRYLQGAIFSSPFHAATSTGEARAFTNAFLARFHSEPDAFSAYAYDAFELVRRTVSAGATSREALARTLAEGRESSTAGASGGLSATREARRATKLLELRGELFIPISDARPPS